MSSYTFWAVMGVATVLLVGSVTAGAASRAAEEPLKIRWLIAHEPGELFERALDVFAEEFEQRSGRSVDVELLLPRDLGATNNRLTTTQVFDELDTGSVQLATVVVGGLASSTVPELRLLQLPFLLQDEASTERVFESEIQAELLQFIDARTTARGLAFTFSGGVMVIASNNTEIHTISDVDGLRIGTVSGPLPEEALRSFGMRPVSMNGSDSAQENHALLDSFNGIEAPYIRLRNLSIVIPKYINETNHSLFLTAIIASDSFYDSLSSKEKKALFEASRVAAAVERKDAIALKEQVKNSLIKAGTKINTLPPETIVQLKERTAPLYVKFEPEFGNLIRKIREIQE